MKKYIKLIIIIVFSTSTFSQDVLVLDNFAKWGMPGVKVFSASSNDTLETNSEGVVNIDFLPDDEIIIFYYPMFQKLGYTKKQLAEKHNTIYMKRSAKLRRENTSLLATSEFSADLPFFTDIINLDDQAIFETDDASGSNSLNMRTYEGGFSVLQGMQADKVLLAIDGIRLNDAIHKNGKIERLLNFKKTMTHSVRKIYNTGFSIYSPSAIGGVINYFTKMPPVSPDYAFHSKIELNSQYQSASNSFVNNLNINLTSAKFTSFSALSYGKYGEIEMGKNRQNVPDKDSTYGLNTHYVKHFNSGDSIVKNDNPYKQHGTDFEQFYFLQKFRYKISDFINIMANFHYVNNSDVGIYSGLTEINFDHPRFAVCKFEPQDKLIGNINLIYEKNTKIFDLMSLNSTFIHYNEYRITRKFQNPVALHQIEKLYVYKFNADFVKIIQTTKRISYGISYDYNKLNSEAFFRNINNDSTWQGLNRYPTNGSFSHNGAVYFNLKLMGNSKIYTNLGIRSDFRYTFAHFSNSSPQLPLSFTKVEYFDWAPIISFNIETNPFGWFYVNLNLSATKYMPIIDDFGKVMVKDFIVNIPTDNLNPEKNYSSKLGLTIFFNDNFKIYTNSIFSYINDAIIAKDTTLADQDSLYFGTDRYEIATNTNIPKAYIFGASAGFNFNQKIANNENISLKLNSSINYVEGINLTENRSLPNISPIYGNGTLTFNLYDFSVKFSTLYNGLKPREELSPVGEDFIEKAATDGFLPWQIFNAKLHYQFKDVFKISAGVDNIFDSFYRPYSTAIAAPGRNYVFSAKIVIK